MADYPDVLDHLGKTPRELGSLQLHVEPLTLEDGWGWTTLSFQAAFEPYDTESTFSVFSVEPAARLLRQAQRVPLLEGGAVQRGNIRFKVPDGVQEVVVKVTSEVLAGSERCRPAWKLFDTFEIARESELRPVAGIGINFGASAAGSLLGAPFGIGVISVDRGGGPAPTLRESVRTTVHKARQLPDGFVVPVLRDAPRPQPPGDRFVALWVPGQPLPEAPTLAPVQRPIVAAGPPASGRMECKHCGFEGKWADYKDDRFCPTCGHDWR